MALMRDELESDHMKIEMALEAYWHGADQQDAEQLNTAFHDDFRVIALTADGNRTLTKNDYIELIKNKQIGGIRREFTLISIEISGVVAQSRLTLKSDAAVFCDHVTLVRSDNCWQMISNVTEINKTM